MPFYEYECTKCNHQTEVFQKISDKPITKCKLCNGKMKKLISQSTFHLKGSGWYVTDYSSKTGGHDGRTGAGDNGTSNKEPAKETKGTDEKPGKKDTAATETKKKKADD